MAKRKQIQEFDTIVVGAGASGMVAALEASKGGSRVLILERMDRPGKKILATGNGKCNMTNLTMEKDCYRGSAKDLARFGNSVMSPDKLRRYFYDLGLATMDRDGYVYPITEQAKSVLSTLLLALSEQKVAIHTGEKVEHILPIKSFQYEVRTEKDIYHTSFLVLATGGMASPKLGSDGSGYQLLKELHIPVKKPAPALTALCSSKKIFKSLSGVRTKGMISLFLDGTFCEKEQGEIQLTDYGISGIPVFQLSRYAIEGMEEGKKAEVELDFFPEWDFGRVRKIVRDFRKKKERSASSLLSGLVHEKWIPVLLKEAGIQKETLVSLIPEKSWNRLIHLLKAYPIPIDGYRDFDFAQACQGGAYGNELTKELESKKYKGLYLTGELVDVDGICGGYNLHWAFTSGYLAGKSIADKRKKAYL